MKFIPVSNHRLKTLLKRSFVKYANEPIAIRTIEIITTLARMKDLIILDILIIE